MASHLKLTLKCFRIADSRHQIFSGYGAEKYGGRWNPIGSAAIYTSQTLSLAMLELRVHLNEMDLPNNHRYIEITSTKDIHTEKVDIQDIKGISVDNDSASKEYGYKWIKEARTVALIVPSIIVPQEYNIVINPAHEDFKLLKASDPKKIKWDQRLFKK